VLVEATVTEIPAGIGRIVMARGPACEALPQHRPVLAWAFRIREGPRGLSGFLTTSGRIQPQVAGRGAEFRRLFNLARSLLALWPITGFYKGDHDDACPKGGGRLFRHPAGGRGELGRERRGG